MCADVLTRFQLLEDCLRASTSEEVRNLVMQAVKYLEEGSFRFDPAKERRLKEALLTKKREEGKRKEFEQRMMRKAKREGREINFYLSLGAEPPTVEELQGLRALPKESAFELWRQRHSQQCYAFHLEPGGCPRDRKCSFLHSDASMSESLSYG
jgi:hypothetical protein